MRIYQFRYSIDNLAYLVAGESSALVVDGGAVEEILGAVDRLGLTLRFIATTHGHPDHTTGSRQLAARSGAAVLDHERLLEMGTVTLDSEEVRVLATPGHTRDSKTFACGESLITGDTLFNGTVGNCFSGDLKAFYDSIRSLLDFPPETRIYAGHDYVAESMAAARSIEPDNPAVDRYLAAYDPDHVVSTLADELAVNPYLRFNAPSMVRILEARGLPVGTEYERWCAVMTAF